MCSLNKFKLSFDRKEEETLNLLPICGSAFWVTGTVKLIHFHEFSLSKQQGAKVFYL